MPAPRVAVIGAGLAGLATAVRLHRAGVDVTVFEARERPGGRVWSERLEAGGAAHTIERGAEFVLDGYDAFRAYCADYDLGLVNTGMSYYVRVPADRPTVTTEQMEDLGARAAEAAASGTGSRSVRDVLDGLDAQGPVREAIDARIEMSTAVRTDQVTAEETLDHVASFAPQPSWRVENGNQGLPNALARELGDRVRYGRRVARVERSGDGAEIEVDGAREAFTHVVVAIPFALLRDPEAISVPLSAARRDAMSRVVQGHAAKIHLALDAVPETSAIMSVSDRFWTWTAQEHDGVVAPVLHGFAGEQGRLAALTGDGGAEWERRVREMRTDVPISAAPAVVTVWETDPLSRGAYSAHAPGFSESDARTLQASEGPIHFAGEYLDVEFACLMEGAIRSGHRTADAILAELAG